MRVKRREREEKERGKRERETYVSERQSGLIFTVRATDANPNTL